MAYTGKPYVVSCNRGGYTGATNIDDIQPFMMLSPSRNINLEKGGRRKRGGTAYVNAAALTGAPRILGIFDCYFSDTTQYLIAATADGDIYKDDTNKIATGLSATNHYDFKMGEGGTKLFEADGANTPNVWSGTGNMANIAEPAADWTTSPPFQFLQHSRGASERMCAVNGTTIYFSKSYAAAGDMEKFVTSAESIRIDTGDGYGLQGIFEYGKHLFGIGKKKAFQVDDSSTTASEWGYEPAQWDGGVAHWRLIIKTPDDVILMSEDGEIYSVTAVQTYGDYKQASLTKDSWMHDWIKANLRLSYIEHFHGIYDPVLRAIKIFVVRNGMTQVDSALLYFIDRPPAEAWMIHDNQSSASGYGASASTVVRVGAGDFKVYTGDYSGLVWKLNQANRNDNSAGYYGGFRTPTDNFGNPRSRKKYDRLWAIGEPQGSYNLQVKVWVDGKYKATKTISLAGTGGVLDSFVLDTDVLGGQELLNAKSKLGYKGNRVQYEFYNSGVNEDFFMSSYVTDYQETGISQ